MTNANDTYKLSPVFIIKKCTTAYLHCMITSRVITIRVHVPTNLFHIYNISFPDYIALVIPLPSITLKEVKLFYLYIRGFNGENNPLSKVEKILTRH